MNKETRLDLAPPQFPPTGGPTGEPAVRIESREYVALLLEMEAVALSLGRRLRLRLRPEFFQSFDGGGYSPRCLDGISGATRSDPESAGAEVVTLQAQDALVRDLAAFRALDRDLELLVQAHGRLLAPHSQPSAAPQSENSSAPGDSK